MPEKAQPIATVKRGNTVREYYILEEQEEPRIPGDSGYWPDEEFMLGQPERHDRKRRKTEAMCAQEKLAEHNEAHTATQKGITEQPEHIPKGPEVQVRHHKHSTKKSRHASLKATPSTPTPQPAMHADSTGHATPAHTQARPPHTGNTSTSTATTCPRCPPCRNTAAPPAHPHATHCPSCLYAHRITHEHVDSASPCSSRTLDKSLPRVDDDDGHGNDASSRTVGQSDSEASSRTLGPAGVGGEASFEGSCTVGAEGAGDGLSGWAESGSPRTVGQEDASEEGGLEGFGGEFCGVESDEEEDMFTRSYRAGSGLGW